MILSNLKFSFPVETLLSTMIVELPSDSIPIEFKAGKTTPILWYWKSDSQTQSKFIFHFAQKGAELPITGLFIHMGSIWLSKAWWQAYREFR